MFICGERSQTRKISKSSFFFSYVFSNKCGSNEESPYALKFLWSFVHVTADDIPLCIPPRLALAHNGPQFPICGPPRKPRAGILFRMYRLSHSEIHPGLLAVRQQHHASEQDEYLCESSIEVLRQIRDVAARKFACSQS